MKRFIVIYIIIMFLICGCVTKRDVTHEAMETIGYELFSNFRFHLSKDITLREIVMLGEHLEQTGPGTITISNTEIHIGRSVIGRFQKENPPNKIEIFFEELPDGNRPTLTFLQDITGDIERYFIETTSGNGFVVDTTGTYGYIKMQGDIVLYNKKHYFLNYHGDERPYLIQELDINVIQERHEIHGIK